MGVNSSIQPFKLIFLHVGTLRVVTFFFLAVLCLQDKERTLNLTQKKQTDCTQSLDIVYINKIILPYEPLVCSLLVFLKLTFFQSTLVVLKPPDAKLRLSAPPTYNLSIKPRGHWPVLTSFPCISYSRSLGFCTQRTIILRVKFIVSNTYKPNMHFTKLTPLFLLVKTQRRHQRLTFTGCLFFWVFLQVYFNWHLFSAPPTYHLSIKTVWLPASTDIFPPGFPVNKL